MDELDELGIYRDKEGGGSHGSGDQGILVEDPLDEDGIWREDPDPLDHYSYRTVHTDSGLGADKKSSSTTLNQVKSDFGSDEDYNQNLAPHREEYNHNLPDTGSQGDSKSSQSYRISELEASESVQGDAVSFENILDSDHDLEFPELNDDSYLFSDQSNQRLRSASQSGASDDKSTDLDKYIRNLKYSDSALRTTKNPSPHRPFALDPAIVGYGDSGSYGEGEGDGLFNQYADDLITAGNNVAASGGGGGVDDASHRYGDRFDERRQYSSEGEDVSDIGEDYDNLVAKVNNSNNVAIATIVAATTTTTKKKHGRRRRNMNNYRGQEAPERDAQNRPVITGDSIFTQEELSVPKHSLHEFEKLEAALDETESENEGDHMDLIGAYLKGLKDRDEEDDHINDQEVASHQLTTADSPAPGTQGNKQRHTPSRIPVPSPTRSLTRSPAKSPIRNGQRSGSSTRSSAKSPVRSGNRSPSKSPTRASGIPSPSRLYNMSPRRNLRVSPARSNTKSPHSRGSVGRSSASPGMRGGEDRRTFSPGSPRMFDTEQNGYRRTRDTISMISGSVDEIMLEPSNTDNEEDENGRDSLDPPREGEPDQDTGYSYDDSIPFDSMIINQHFPYVDDPYSSLHAYDFKDDGLDEESLLSRTESPQRSTKIPMLRSRSPSMSRPGSSLGNRSRPTSRGPYSRPESPARKALGPNQTGIPLPNGNSSMKGSRRSLPLTPKKRKSGEEPQSLDTSIETNLKTPRSVVNGEIVAPYSARSDTGGVLEIGYQLSQAESELGRATNLLMMDDEEMKKNAAVHDIIVEEEKDEVPTLLSMKTGSGRKSGGVKAVVGKAQRREVGELMSSPPQQRLSHISPEPKLSQEEYSGGEDLSQGSIASKSELKNRFVQEVTTRKRNEETVKQLSMEYSNLLKKYAEAENTIDELRLGAKVTLYSNSPTPSNAQSGTTHIMHHPGSYPVPMTTGQVAQEGSQGIPAKAELGLMPDQGHRPPSRTSQGSSVAMGTDHLSLQPQAPSLNPSLSHDELESLAGEGIKLSLLTKAKGIEEQVNAFRILLEENHLTIEDQTKAMENIKGNYDSLQKDYHVAKEEHEYIRRQGVLTEATTTEVTTGFDEEKEVAGELYKLNMNMDELEHSVQENSKKIAASRKPFAGKSGPVRADHSLFGLDKQGGSTSVEKSGGSALDGLDPHQLPMNRLTSTGSIAGTADVDERLHQLSKRYNSLMDKYRQLKGLKATPLRNQEIESLLERIKEVYEETPDHRKPPLPPELENKYDTTKGSFVKPEEIPESPESASPRPVFGSRSKPPDHDMASTDDRDSDYRTDRFRHHPSRSPPRRARYGSMDSDSTDYTGKTPAVHPSRAHVAADSESDLNSPRVGRSLSQAKDHRELRRLPKPGPGSGSRRKDSRLTRADGGDSGYFGSEGSRKAVSSGVGGSSGRLGGDRSTGAAASVGHGSRGFPSRRGTTGTSLGTTFSSPRSREDAEVDSDASSSGSASSVIERKLERQRQAKEQGTGKDASPLDGPSRSGLSIKTAGVGEGGRGRSRSRSRSKQAGLSESDRSGSLNSGELASPRSEKLRSLSDEVDRLKATLSGTAAPPPQQPQLLVHGHPQPLVTAHTNATTGGIPGIIPQPQIGVAPQTTPVVNFADPAAVALGNQPAMMMNGYPVYSQDPALAAVAPPLPQVVGGAYDYYTDYNNYNGQLPPSDHPRQYYEPEYEEYGEEEADYEPYHYDRRRRSLERRGGEMPYRGQHRSSSRDRYGGDGYDSRDSPPRDSYINDYDSRDRDFNDVKDANRLYSRGRKASLPDNHYYGGDGYEGQDSRSRSSRGPHQRRLNQLEDLLDEYDPSGARSQERRGRQGRNKSHERYYSDPESPAHSPSRYSEMRRYYIPKRGSSGGHQARDHSGSRGSPNGRHFSRRERYLSPTRTRPIAGRPPLPRGGPNGLPPPYPRVGGNAYHPRAAVAVAPPPVAGVYSQYPQSQLQGQHAVGTAVQPSAYTSGVVGAQVHPTYGQTAAAAMTTVPGVSSQLQQQPQMTSCPTCGGQSTHTHSNFVFQPQPLHSGTTTTATAVSTGQNTNQNSLVPVQLVPVGSSTSNPGTTGSAKVRYYVREYGGESNSDVNGKLVQRKSRRMVKTMVLSDESDVDDDDDMDESLNKALRTAKKLKKMSVRMKQTLHDEINKSIQDGSFLMT